MGHLLGYGWQRRVGSRVDVVGIDGDRAAAS
jgi:hypothetical protein